MAQISRSTKIGGGTVLQSNTVARATDVETDVLALFNEHNNHDDGSTNWGTVSAENASSTPLITNNAAGTNDIFDARDNGVSALKVADGGTLTVSVGGTPRLTVADSTTTIANVVNMVSNKITVLADGTGATDAAAFGQLKILQIQSATSTTSFSTTSSTFQSTNLTVSITPASTSNTILLIASSTLTLAASGGVSAFATFARGGSNILASEGQSQIFTNNSIGDTRMPFTLSFIDSPASVASQTYDVQIRNSDNTTSVAVPNSSNLTQFIIAFELAG